MSLEFFSGIDNSLDAFSRLRVSNPTAIFAQQFRHEPCPYVWDETTSGSASSTYQQGQSLYEMDVTTASGDKIVRQTRQHYVYIPGRSHYIIMSGVIKAITQVWITKHIAMAIFQEIHYFST